MKRNRSEKKQTKKQANKQTKQQQQQKQVKYRCMNFIIITSKTKMATTENRDYYSQILTSWRMKLKLKMFKTILARVNKCLILVIIPLSWNITIIQTH